MAEEDQDASKHNVPTQSPSILSSQQAKSLLVSDDAPREDITLKKETHSLLDSHEELRDPQFPSHLRSPNEKMIGNKDNIFPPQPPAQERLSDAAGYFSRKTSEVSSAHLEGADQKKNIDMETGVSCLDEPSSAQGPEEQEEGEEEDGGVIRCICECDDDDGFTIQCDACLVWQHCACFGMSQATVPDVYHCERCDPRPVDVPFAKEVQRRRREADDRRNTYQKNFRRPSFQEDDTGAENGTEEGLYLDKASEASRQRKTSSGSGISRSRKPSQQLDLSQLGSIDPESSPTSTTPVHAKSHRKKGSTSAKPGPRRREMSSLNRGSASYGRDNIASTLMTTNVPGERVEEDASLDTTEAWHFEFTPISKDLVTESKAKHVVASLAENFATGPLIKAQRGTGNRMLAPVLGKRVKTLANLNSDDTPEEIDAPSPSLGLDKSDLGLSAVGNECIPVEIAVPTLTNCTQRTTVRSISEMAAANIFNSLIHINRLPSEPQRSSSANRMFSKPTMHGLFAEASIPTGCFISVYTGELLSAERYRENSINQYRQIGASKPCTHIFPPPLSICIDARRYGNIARFARSSCHPNTVIRPIIHRKTASFQAEEDDVESLREMDHNSGDEKVDVHFGLFAISDIPKGHEITLGWEWDDCHIVHILPQLVRNPLLGIFPVNEANAVSVSSRSWDREKRSEAIAALVDKGEFPYAGTSFSVKINDIMTVLLSSCLCACIGSAVASNGGSASSNNVKRQDCAIVQMLRLSQGMGMLNVSMPTSKTNRKSRLPDFEPLVGKQRWWRPEVMPPTPSSDEGISRPKDNLYRDLQVSFKIAHGGKVARVSEEEFNKALSEVPLGQRRTGSESSEDDDSKSQASSATDPLSAASEESDADDVLDTRDDGVAITHRGDAPYLVRRSLPPKKRISGTRLKAFSPGFEGSDIEYRGRKKRRSSQGERQIRPRSQKRAVHMYSSDDGEDDVELPFKSRRSPAKLRSRLIDPSSPLSDVPTSENEDQVKRRAERTDKKPLSNNKSKGEDLKKAKQHSSTRNDKSLKAPKKRELLADFSDDSESDLEKSSKTEHDVRDQSRMPSAYKPHTKMAKRKHIASSEEEGDAEGASVRHPEYTVEQRSAVVPVRDQTVESAIPLPETSLPTAPPPPPVELPKAKLSLAEYKKRLAERRSSNQTSQVSPLTTTGAVPASPEKVSLPSTPLETPTSAPPVHTGFHFPLPAPSDHVSTPVQVKTEFVPHTALISRASPTSKTPSLETGREPFGPIAPLASPVPIRFPVPLEDSSTQSSHSAFSTSTPSRPPSDSLPQHMSSSTSREKEFPFVGEKREPDYSEYHEREPESRAGTGVEASGVSFNPPRGPRALVNPGSSAAPMGNAATPVRPESPRSTAPVPRRPSFTEVSTSATSLPRSQSPIHQSPSRASSLGDFANVPKGPARMRDREYREYSTTRDRDYSTRPIDDRGWDYSMYDRAQTPRRNDEDRYDYTYAGSRPYSHQSSYHGSRGAYSNPRGTPYSRGWSGRARTRGRGSSSRGAWGM